MDRYFEENVYPVLTPMAVDSSRPFPLIRNKSLNIGALIAKKDDPREETGFRHGAGSLVCCPVWFIFLTEKTAEKRVILLEEIIERNIGQLFLNYDVICADPYRIMRNADLTH